MLGYDKVDDHASSEEKETSPNSLGIDRRRHSLGMSGESRNQNLRIFGPVD